MLIIKSLLECNAVANAHKQHLAIVKLQHLVIVKSAIKNHLVSHHKKYKVKVNKRSKSISLMRGNPPAFLIFWWHPCSAQAPGSRDKAGKDRTGQTVRNIFRPNFLELPQIVWFHSRP